MFRYDANSRRANSRRSREQPTRPGAVGPAPRLQSPLLASAAVALSLVVAPSIGWAQDAPQFSELRVLIEINATDGDAGFQAMIDGDEWKQVSLYGPNERRIYHVKGEGAVQDQGLTENFFESAEPSCEEVPLDVVLGRFPPGEYEVEGRSTENDKMEEETILTHALPGAPEDLEPDQEVVADAFDVTISWSVGDTLENCPDLLGLAEILDEAAELFGFQVVVGRELPEPLLEFVAEVPASSTSITIPAEFLQTGAIYKYEVVAIEDRGGERGNQTISESFFCTPPFAGDCELPE